MEKYGIDFILSSWWGNEQVPEEDITLRDNIVPELSGRPIKFTIYYELLKPEMGGLDNGWMVIDNTKHEQLVKDFNYIADTYFSHPNFLFIDGKPTVFLYLSRLLAGSYVDAFNKIRSELQTRGYGLYLVGDEMGWGEPSASHMQILDGISPYSMYGLPGHDGYPLDVDFYADVSVKTAEWEAVCKSEGKTFIPNPYPGANNRAVRLNANYAAPRQSTSGADNGSAFKEYIKVMQTFVDPDLKMMTITSWNEWHEDTQIEPTIVTPFTNQDISSSGTFYTQGYGYEGYGFKYLEIVRELLASALLTHVDSEQLSGPIPDAFWLEQNYPNPFNPETTIAYQLPQSAEVTLTIYDLQGHEVRKLDYGRKSAGYHAVKWDGRNEQGWKVSSGIYFFRIEMKAKDGGQRSFVAVKKMILMKEVSNDSK